MFSILNLSIRLPTVIQLLSIFISLIYIQIGHALIIPTNSGQLEAITIRSVDGNWQTISLENTYTSSVVVCTHQLASTSDNPAVVRIRNAGTSSFEIRLQEPRNSTNVTAANVYCLVAEEGANQLADGRNFEARTVVSDDVAGDGIPGPDWNGRGENVSAALTNTYTNPVVLGQVMTFNDPDFSIFWSYDCESNSNPPFDSGFADGICVGKHIGEDDADETRNDETLGYFVIEGGSGAAGTIPYQTALGPDNILGVTNSPPYPYNLNDTYNFGVATIEAMDGTNGGFANLFGTNPFENNQLDLVIDEDQLRDNERSRTTDQMGFWVFKESDYGDAPDSYSTLDASGGPEHLIQSGFSISSVDDIFIGNSSTSELDGDPATEGSPATNDTDDGNISFPLTAADFSAGDDYTVSVPYTGNARLCGWIDFDYNSQAGDGTFETDERSCIDTSTCSGGGTTGSCDLIFTAPTDFIHNDDQITYARFRIGPNATEVESPTGIAFGGEVEDYEISVDTLPVTLSHISSTRIADVLDVDWGTSSELFNVGFQLWGLDGVDGRWEKLHNFLIKSGSGNAVEPQSYSKRVRLPDSIDQLVSVGLSSVDSDGSEHYYGPFEVGHSYGELGSLSPIDWGDVRAELDARMVANGYVKDRIWGYRKVSSDAVESSAFLDQLETVIEFHLVQDGLYRIKGSELPQNWQATQKRELAVIDHLGQGVVRDVRAKGEGSGSDKTLGANGEIYFYGRGPDEEEGLYTESNVYRLVLDRGLVRTAQVQSKQGVTSGFSDSYVEHSEVEQDTTYILNSALDDPWVDAVMVGYTDQPQLYGTLVPVEGDALWDEGSSIHLRLGRSSGLPGIDGDGDGEIDAEHVVEGVVFSGGGLVSVGEARAVGTGGWDISLPVPGGVVFDEANGSVLIGGSFSAGEGYALSEVHVDGMGVSYRRPYVSKAGEDHLQFTGPDEGETGYTVRVPKQGNARVFATDGSNLVKLKPESKTTVTDTEGRSWNEVTFAVLQGGDLAEGSLKYWVGNRSGFLGVAGLVEKSVASELSLFSQTQGSDYVIVSHPSFMGVGSNGVDHLSAYADFKRSQGHTVSLINYLDIEEVFGGGQAGPEGLSRFLSELKGQSPGLKYVLLVGGSVYDHTDKLETGALTFIPGHYTQSNYSNYTVSDVPYITDAQGTLFAHIGRWPVRTGSDLQVIVDKSIQWANGDHSSGDVLLIAEHTVEGEEIDFGSALDGVAEILPGDYIQHRVYVDEILASDPSLTLPEAIAQAKGEIIDALNLAPDVVLFNGHASTRALSNQNLFKASEISQVTATGAEIWVPLSCYVTYYESTHVDTLAHQLLFSGNAVNISGAMLLSNQGENVLMGESILNRTLNQGETLGEAVNQSKAAQNNPNLTNNWSILGDPSSVLMTQ